MKITDYPSYLVQNRHVVEANFVFCLWKEPDLYDDYVVNQKQTNTTAISARKMVFFIINLGFNCTILDTETLIM